VTSQIYDCFTFFNELDLLEIRLNELSDTVDMFVIAEAPVTFQGAPKPLYFYENRDRFAKFADRIRHVVVNDMQKSENPWEREWHQRNALRRGFADAPPDATILIADADEIPSAAAMRALAQRKDLTYLQMPLYVYCMNYQVMAGEDAPTIASYGGPKHILDVLRDLSAPRNGTPDNYLNRQGMSELSHHLIEEGGWHFSWLGKPEMLQQKLKAFSHTQKRYTERASTEELTRIMAERRFFVTESPISVRPLSEMPQSVRDNIDYYVRNELLSADAPDTAPPVPVLQGSGRSATLASSRVSMLGVVVATPQACPVCGSKALTEVATKFAVTYMSCGNCNAVFSGPLQGLPCQPTEDGTDVSANLPMHRVRLQRLLGALGRRSDTILDFGSARSGYADSAKSHGIRVFGMERNATPALAGIPPASVDGINMVETIQRLSDPVETMTQLAALLKPGGIIYVESSFVDFIGNPARSDYVDPFIGQCCIHSRKSIDYLCRKLGLRAAWMNNNVVFMHKAVEAARISAFWH
jgi:beta-1,4-mannosyl-glycoprotein beta-1,4-N-acetylglucosaminyltransferase